ncbi:MAG: META domain-containing protein [Flavobacteriales bacterium]|nr:META domain-containing protein [Flavobacteriales bacterium]HRH68733.1 META domain-containing protein [Flavobacteriales bacterium]
MIKRLAATVPTLVLSYAMLGSVVFTGISLSSKLMGRWRVVKVFGSDVPTVFPPMTIELDKSGKLVGRSRCGTFTGRWSTGNNEVRFQGLVPSSCTCGDLRVAEQKFLEAIGSARQTKIGKDGLMLMSGGKPVALLVPQRT